MNSKALRILEYDKIIRLLEEEATSESGKEKCRKLIPMDDLGMIHQAQKETADAFSRIVKKGNPSFSGVTSVEASLKRLAIGGTLNSGELLKLSGVMETASVVKNYGKPERADEKPDSLTIRFGRLEPLTSLSREIRRCIIAEDEFSDDASPTLRHIRRQIAQINDKVHSTLSGMLNGAYRSYLQDAIVTLRNDRYCLPVKAEYKNHISGMVHDQSSSGMTLFIEPMAIIKLNNDLRELLGKEQEEIQVILANLSSRVAENSGFISQNFSILTELDYIFARGRLALNQNASMPVFNEEGRVKIRKGRHPLLDSRKVVPIDLELGKEFSMLVVTGPNTGGKTVSLKTIGLLTLMGEAGLHIPAGDRSELSLFREVYADIGDEQSIEQSLSTFSSHMTNIVEILKCVGEKDLVLFDELGAGTDPTEGAALAIAILSNLHEKNIRCMATTHYSELKIYAMTTDGVQNASCEFDVETLRPTYRILIGVPGKSNAFAISLKLGLSDDIIREARYHIDEDDISFEDVLSELESKRIHMEEQEKEIHRFQKENEELKKSLEKERRILEEEKDKILRKASLEADKILREAKEYADETMKNFRKFGKENISVSDMEREREKLRKKLAKSQSDLSDSFQSEPHKQHKPEEFHVGDTVKVHSMNVKGTVQTLPDAKGYLYIQMGIIRSKISYTDLTILPDEDASLTGKSGKKAAVGSGKIKMGKALTVSTELNLRGMTVDEALAILDKYLDDAYLARLSSVRIVHGKGTGALREAVQRYLKSNKHVKSYRLGAFGEGDSGVTICEMKGGK